MIHPKKVWHLVEGKGWHKKIMEAVDATHAVSVDPEHWSFTNPDDASETESQPHEPTVTEWVEAGYKASNYRYTKSSAEEIATAIAAEKASSSGEQS